MYNHQRKMVRNFHHFHTKIKKYKSVDFTLKLLQKTKNKLHFLF